MASFRAIKAAIELGIEVEKDPTMASVVPDLTEDQIDWLASWLASESIGKVRRHDL